MVIMPTGGLCNYLRVIFYYYQEAKEKKENLFVIWNVTNACNGFFLDYFEPIEGITFLKDNKDNLDINYRGCDVPYYPNYKDLKLLPEIKFIINEKKSLLKDYISIHVRRTDHINLAKSHNIYTEDEKFFRWIEAYIKDKNLYIATDNLDSYNIFKNKYNERVKFEYHEKLNGLRQTSLKDAIIDLYMCVFSKHFMGSGYSSFSATIKNLRRNMMAGNYKINLT